MITKNKDFNVVNNLLLSMLIFAVFSEFDLNSNIFAATNSSQAENFNNDLNNANTYWVHNKLGSAYFGKGDYNNAINEYKIAIDIVENIPGEKWTNVSKEEMDRINKESRNFKQIFPRYGLIEALEKAGRYKEALENVEWLIKNQAMKGKEEFLKRRLEGMKQNLLQKMRDNRDRTLK